MNSNGTYQSQSPPSHIQGRICTLVLLVLFVLCLAPAATFAGKYNKKVITFYVSMVDENGNNLPNARYDYERRGNWPCSDHAWTNNRAGKEELSTELSCVYYITFQELDGYYSPEPASLGPLSWEPGTTYGSWWSPAYTAVYRKKPTQTIFNMDISPASASTYGAKWQIKKLSGTDCVYKNSGEISEGEYSFNCPVNEDCQCDYEVSLVDADYHATPTEITLTYPDGTLITVPIQNGVFTLEDVPSDMSSYTLSAKYKVNAVRVVATLAPDTAVTAGAKWKVIRSAEGLCTLEDSGWLASGVEYVFSDVEENCTYSIEFDDLSGWVTPTSETFPDVPPKPDTYYIGPYTYGAPTGPICDDFNDGVPDPHWRFVDNTNSWEAAYPEEKNGKLYLHGRGSNQFSSVDEYAALYLTEVEGDFEAVVEIVNFNNTSGYSKCGIMFRNDISDSYNSLGYGFFGLTDSYGFAGYYDSTNNGILNNSHTVGSTGVPRWIKVQRAGDVFTGYYSTDGSTWTFIRSMTLSTANDSMDIGLFESAYTKYYTKTVEFDNFCVTEAAAKVAFKGLIEPAGARPNARWRLFNKDTGQWETDWMQHDTTAMVLSGNTYDIYWSTIDGYIEPSPNPVSSKVIPAEATSWTGNYTAIVTTTTTTLETSSTTTTTTTTAPSSTTTTTTIPGTLCLPIADVPMETQLQAAPASIMFILDDSGSMDWCFMTDESDGLFSSKYYNWFMSDASYSSGAYLTDHSKWKAKYHGYNHMYYDPSATYDPWPNYGNADVNSPRSDPTKTTPTLALADTYITVDLEYIVDDLDGSPDFVYTEQNGASFGTSSSSQAIVDNHYLYSNAQGDYTVVWTPNGLPSGTYKLYVNWVETSDRGSDIVYTINHSLGSVSTPVYDQRSNGGTWQQLISTDSQSEFKFTGAADENVTLTYSVTSSPNNKICADAVKWVPSTGTTSVDVKNAHYYVYSATEDSYYLVNLDGEKQYYRFGNNDTNYVTEAFLMRDYNPPSDIIGYDKYGMERTYTAEIQNFANWFSFYRRRELAAKAAVGSVVDGMQGVQIGLYTINSSSHRLGVKQVRITSTDSDGVQTFTDESDTVLGVLYDSQSSGSTPLRLGLKNVGEYFKENGSSSLKSGWPYYSSAGGGDCQQSFAIVMTDGYWNGNSPGVGNQDGGEGTPYADSWSDTLADVAMKYYKSDLSPTLGNMVPTSFLDSATYQHMVTYSISFGVTGSLDPNDFDLYNSNPSARVYPTWPNPTAAEKNKIDDMWHAAVNGRGEFLSASNPAELVDSLQALLQDVVSRIGSGASVSVNGEELQTGTMTYQSSYSADGWTGDLKAYSLNANTASINMDVAVWSTKEWLDDANWDTERVLATYTGSSGVPFRWSDISAYQQTLLLDENRLNFVRGDDTNEVHNGGSFRDRVHVLGDLIHSAPRYFNDALYVGGNDGMLHAVDSANGSEMWGYIPLQVFHNLYLLAETNYSHNFYVDLTPSVRSAGATDLLVSGLGKGGKGYFCIDITNSNSITTESQLANSIKWEYPRSDTPAADVADMGYSFSLAWIIRTTQGWSVIFGNGYSSDNQSAVLFVLDALTGELIRKIDTGVSGVCNGLSTPLPVDTDYDNVVDAAYAGDLKGNLWKFDLSSADPASWGVAFSSGGSPEPLITVKGPSGNIQPITTAPVAMAHCDSTLPGYLVIFGTGKYLGDTDFDDSSVQTLYGVWDFASESDQYFGTLNNSAGTVSNNAAVLVEQSEEAWVSEFNSELRIMTDVDIEWVAEDTDTADLDDYKVTNIGWYFNLPITKERIVTELTLSSSTLTAISTIPKDSMCSAGGESVLMQLDPCTGGRFSKARADINGDGLINVDDMVTIITSTGESKTVAVSGELVNGRLYAPVYVSLPDYDADGDNVAGTDTTGDGTSDDTTGIMSGIQGVEYSDANQSTALELGNAQDATVKTRLVIGEGTGLQFWMEMD